MKLKKVCSLVCMGATIATSVVVLSSCTCKINEEQLAKIAELRKQEKSLTAEIATENSNRAKINNELQSINSQAKDCDKRLQIVKQRLQEWPNVWPDYSPKP